MSSPCARRSAPAERSIIRQLLTEALLLSLTGAALGLVLAYKTVAVIVANLPEFSFPHEAAIQINLPVLCLLHRGRRGHGNSLRSVAGAAALAA